MTERDRRRRAAGIARVERRRRCGSDVVDAAAAHGLAALHGSSPDVGVAGYSLGGGIGWYARKLGLAANSLTARRARHRRRHAWSAPTPTTNPELFWALRGGGGNFGVVTALEFRLFDIETAYAGMLIWDLRAAPSEVLRAWAAWAPTAPDEVTTSFRMLQPAAAAGAARRSCAAASSWSIDGAVLGRRRAAAGSPRPAARARARRSTRSRRVPAAALVRLHMDPEGARPSVSDSAMLGALPDAGDRRVPRRRPARTPSTSLLAGRAAPARRRARRARTRAAVRWRSSTASSWSSPWPWPPRRRWAAQRARGRRPR